MNIESKEIESSSINQNVESELLTDIKKTQLFLESSRLLDTEQFRVQFKSFEYPYIDD